MTLKYFSFDRGWGFELHATAREARARAMSALLDISADAEDGWSEDVGDVCWGEIRQSAQIVSTVGACTERACGYRNLPDGVAVEACDGHHRSEVDTIVDYDLIDVGDEGRP